MWHHPRIRFLSLRWRNPPPLDGVLEEQDLRQGGLHDTPGPDCFLFRGVLP